MFLTWNWQRTERFALTPTEWSTGNTETDVTQPLLEQNMDTSAVDAEQVLTAPFSAKAAMHGAISPTAIVRYMRPP